MFLGHHQLHVSQSVRTCTYRSPTVPQFCLRELEYVKSPRHVGIRLYVPWRPALARRSWNERGSLPVYAARSRAVEMPRIRPPSALVHVLDVQCAHISPGVVGLGPLRYPTLRTRSQCNFSCQLRDQRRAHVANDVINKGAQ
jgi:hypothetical protein